jgi:hypothetical protein
MIRHFKDVGPQESAGDPVSFERKGNIHPEYEKKPISQEVTAVVKRNYICISSPLQVWVSLCQRALERHFSITPFPSPLILDK